MSQRPAAMFPQYLLDAGWEPAEKVIFIVPLFRWSLEITEPRFRSPYTGKYHKTKKALHREMKAIEKGLHHPLFV